MTTIISGHHIPENQATVMINEFGVIILIDELGQSMICQDELKDKLVTAIYKWVQNRKPLVI